MTRRRLGPAVERLMANKTKATPEEEEAREQGPEIPDALLPLLDLSDAAIKQATKRGSVTYEQLNAIMPSEEVTPQQIEELWRRSTRGASTWSRPRRPRPTRRRIRARSVRTRKLNQ